jgi:hypothetical protein
MRTLGLIILSVALLAVLPGLSQAQNPDARTQSRLTQADSAAVLLQAAGELRDQGEPDAAQALLRLIIDRFGSTPAAAQARIDLGLVENAQSSSSGRVELQVWSALYGLYMGLAIPGAASADGPEAYGVGLLLGGPAGFLAASSYTKRHPLTQGQARAITLGGTWGTWQGLGWANVAGLGEDDFVCSGDVCFAEDNPNTQLWASLAGGAVGIVAGAVIARRTISPGLATTANFGALWGTWFGLAGGVLADLEGDGLFAATLLAGNAGLASSALLGRDWNLTRSRARLISIAGVLGGLAGAGVLLIAQPDGRWAISIPLAGSVAGLVIGAEATRNESFSGSPSDEDSYAFAAGADIPSLLSVRAGELRVGLPLPSPNRILLSADGRDRTALTNRVTLFSMRF